MTYLEFCLVLYRVAHRCTNGDGGCIRKMLCGHEGQAGNRGSPSGAGWEGSRSPGAGDACTVRFGKAVAGSWVPRRGFSVRTGTTQGHDGTPQRGRDWVCHGEQANGAGSSAVGSGDGAAQRRRQSRRRVSGRWGRGRM